MMISCPLCQAINRNEIIAGADSRKYYLCAQCSLVFVDPCHFLPPDEEKRHYATHENHLQNEGYVHFLNQVLEPMLPYLDKQMRALDYGCGPGPTLSQLLRQQGIACDDYDPFFIQASFQPPYDVIFATECFEHFHHPETEIRNVCHLLKAGGLLGVMTERWTTTEQFKTWYYTKDPTHVCFYHANTFDYLCRQYGFVRIWEDAKRVNIFSYRP